jgi:hypothetical protein
MDQTTALGLIVLLAVIGIVVWMVMRRERSTRLRHRFGPEYDRMVDLKGSPRLAEAELRDRSKRVDKLNICPLPPERRELYARRWKDHQARFVDEPKAAIDDADHLVEEVMKERGYPVSDFDQRVADISVDHPAVVQNYRAAHDIAIRERRGQATTEDLRNAMIYYRNLFMELLEDRPTPKGATVR